MGKAIFVTGTNTDVGKTYISGLIVKKLREMKEQAGYYKAALSGADVAADGRLIPGDVREVQQLSGLGATKAPVVSYVYKDAVSPHLAAQLANQPIDPEQVCQDFQQAKAGCDYLTMEGSGGIVCPLRWDHQAKILLADVVLTLKLPVILVAQAGLGTINDTVLSVAYMKARGIPIKGIILNHFHVGDVMEEDNLKMIEEMTAVPVIATVADGDGQMTIDGYFLASMYE